VGHPPRRSSGEKAKDAIAMRFRRSTAVIR